MQLQLSATRQTIVGKSREQDRKDGFREGSLKVSYEAQRKKKKKKNIQLDTLLDLSKDSHCIETESELPVPRQNSPEK